MDEGVDAKGVAWAHRLQLTPLPSSCAGATYRVNDEVSRTTASRVLGVDRQRNLPQVLRRVTTAARTVEVVEQDVTEASHSVEQACDKTLR